MGLLSLNLPVIGQSSATEDQKVRDALAAIQTDYNGNLTDANISATAGIQQSKLANGATGMAIGSFSSYRAGAANMLTGQIAPFDTEEWDVSGWHDAVTSQGRYTPQVAGYYRFSWGVRANAALTADVVWIASLAKNGSIIKNGMIGFQRGASAVNSVGSHLAQANGTTDFFEIIVTHTAGVATAISANSANTFFAGELVGRS